MMEHEEQSTSATETIAFLIDVSSARTSSTASEEYISRVVSGVERLLAHHARCTLRDLVWVFRIFDSSQHCVSLATNRLEPHPISERSIQGLREDLARRAEQTSLRSWPSMDFMAGAVARALEDFVCDVEWAKSGDDTSVDSLWDDEVTPASCAVQKCSGGHDRCSSVYVFAPFVDLTGRNDVTEPSLVRPSTAKFKVERKASKNISQGSSFQGGSFEKTRKVRLINHFRRVFELLQKRSIRFTWVNNWSGAVDNLKANPAATISMFRECMSSILKSPSFLHLDSLVMDRRIVPFQALMQRTETLRDSGDGIDCSSERAVEGSLWHRIGVLVDSGVERSKNESMNIAPFRFTAELGGQPREAIPTELQNAMHGAEASTSSHHLLVLRAYVDEVGRDDDLFQGKAFESAALLLRPVPKFGDGLEALSTGDDASTFSNLMLFLARKRQAALADIFEEKEGRVRRVTSLLIQPVTALLAIARSVSLCSSSKKIPDITAFHGTNFNAEGSDQICTVRHPQQRTDATGTWVDRYLSMARSPRISRGRQESSDTPNSSGDSVFSNGVQSLATAFENFVDAHPPNSHIGTNSHGKLCPGFECPTVSVSIDVDIEAGRSISEMLAAKVETEVTSDARTGHSQSLKLTSEAQQAEEPFPSPSKVVLAAENAGHDEHSQEPLDLPNRAAKKESPSGNRVEPREPEKSFERPTNIGDVIDNLCRRQSLFNSTSLCRVVSQRGRRIPVTSGTDAQELLHPQDHSPSNRNMQRMSGCIPRNAPNSLPDGEHGLDPMKAAIERLTTAMSSLSTDQNDMTGRTLSRGLNELSLMTRTIARASRAECFLKKAAKRRIKKTSDVLSSLDAAVKEARSTKADSLPTVPHPVGAALLMTYEQAMWHIVEGVLSERQPQKRTDRSGKRRRSSKRAISLLASVQATSAVLSEAKETQNALHGAFSAFFTEVIAELMNGNNSEDYQDVVKPILAEYEQDIKYGGTDEQHDLGQLRVNKLADPKKIRPSQPKLVSRAPTTSDKPTHLDENSSRSDRKRVDGLARGRDRGNPAKRLRTTTTRDPQSILASARNRSMLVRHMPRPNGVTHGIDLVHAKGSQKPLLMASSKKRRASQIAHTPEQLRTRKSTIVASRRGKKPRVCQEMKATLFYNQEDGVDALNCHATDNSRITAPTKQKSVSRGFLESLVSVSPPGVEQHRYRETKNVDNEALLPVGSQPGLNLRLAQNGIVPATPVRVRPPRPSFVIPQTPEVPAGPHDSHQSCLAKKRLFVTSPHGSREGGRNLSPSLQADSTIKETSRPASSRLTRSMKNQRRYETRSVEGTRPVYKEAMLQQKLKHSV